MDEQDAPLLWRKGNELVAKRGNERFLAERVLEERKERGWSQAQLSKELAKVGSPLQQSAILKIESPPKGERRSISIGEAIGFARVFGIPLGELLLPPEAIWDAELFDGLTRAAELFEAARIARETMDDAILDLCMDLMPSDEENAVATEMAKYWRRDVVDNHLEKYGALEAVDQIDLHPLDMRGSWLDDAILVKRYLKATNVTSRQKIDKRLDSGQA